MSRFALLVACHLAVFIIGCQHVPLGTGKIETESDRLNRWFETRYEEALFRSPLALTMLGRRDRYDEIDDFSEAAADERLHWRARTVEDLRANFDYTLLTDDAKISYDIWSYQYEAAKALAAYRRHEYLFSQMNGAHARLPTLLISQHRVESESDMRAYAARVGELARAIDQLLERARLSANEGIRPPRFAYEAVIEESKKLLGGHPFDVESDRDSPIWADANRKIGVLLDTSSIDDELAGELRALTKKQLLESFGPAYRRLIAWAHTEIEFADPIARGVSALPDGTAYYEAKLAHATTTAMTAAEIHEIGLKEVARIRTEMEAVKQLTGFRGSLQEFFTFVRTDEQFFYSNDDTGRQAYLDDSTAYLDHIRSRLPDFFGLLPKTDLVVRRVESFREQDGAPQHYYGGTPDGSRPGVYYAHLSDMKSMSKVEMEAIAYHEGNPGHHMQVSIALERTEIPLFRRRAFFNSYGEGWGLYAESLAKEMGAYQSPYTEFGRLLTEMWRAIRLVVDTGIHSKGWTEERAIAFFRANSALSAEQIRAEVRRYFVWPGQATSYKIGMLKIQELRTRANEELGTEFDIRRFHDTILGGGMMPLWMLERSVDEWIRRSKGSSQDLRNH